MAPALYHGLDALGLPVVCIESRQAYQALKSLATRKTDRNDARGLAHLARTGFYKPVHVKSLSAHPPAVGDLIQVQYLPLTSKAARGNWTATHAPLFNSGAPRSGRSTRAPRRSEAPSGAQAASTRTAPVNCLGYSL